MRTAQLGDRVLVSYVKRFPKGPVLSSREPFTLTVGVEHRRLPGLGTALVGLAAGQAIMLTVPPEQAYGLSDPGRLYRWRRQRFPVQLTLQPGKLVRVKGKQGRRRLVRIVEVDSQVVVVDANHPWAGQTMDLDVQLIAICDLEDARLQVRVLKRRRSANSAKGQRSVEGVACETVPRRGRAVAFDVDPDSLASLRQAFPEWEIDALAGADTGSLKRDWNPGTTDLLIVGARAQLTETLGLCRGLRSQVGRAYTPLVVLVPAAQEALVSAALDAGADSCLVLPIHPKSLINMMASVLAGNRPGRHTLGLDRAQQQDHWQDPGGEG